VSLKPRIEELRRVAMRMSAELVGHVLDFADERDRDRKKTIQVYWVVNRRSIGWSPAFRRRGPAEGDRE
jgi:hypothetical protein